MIQMQDINCQDIVKFDSLLETASNITIVTHMKPDGDALGSSLAMYSFSCMIGKRCRIVLPHRYPANLSFLISTECIDDIMIHEDAPAAAEEAISSADLIICLDFNAFSRTDRLRQALESAVAKKVLIDHHLNPDRPSFDLIFSETEISSASELLYHILMGMPQIKGDPSKLPSPAVNALMTGMTTDTNNFANSVYPSTFRMASGLLEAGADRDTIISSLYNMFSESRLRLLGLILKDLTTITEYGVAYIVLDSATLKKYKVIEGDTEGFVNMPLSIKDVRMSILVKEDEGLARVSIRSKKGVSANTCARMHFNGGGHENAAGGKLLIPDDISDISCAGQYIEQHTETFFNS